MVGKHVMELSASTVTQHAIPDSGQVNPNYPHCWRRSMVLVLLSNEFAFEMIGVAQNMR